MSETPPQGNVTKMPARIRDGVCSNCKVDVGYAVAALKAGTIKKIEHCPNCGTPIVESGVTELIWQCRRCKTRILYPGTQKRCTKCAADITISINTEEDSNQDAQKD